ncbi:MAG: acyltransferase [Desulfobacterales bacterium]|nr:acyltransferase [Desulfobacterales bacterium]
MQSFIPGPLKGVLSFTGFVVNTIFWVIPIFIIAFLKLIFPLKIWRKICDAVLNWLAGNWIAVNCLNLRLVGGVHWDVRGIKGLKMDAWYLVVANHQSWVDILVLQKIFHRKIPFLKFFLKKELIWVPVLGLAWWALDFPFMKRYSTAFLKRNPHLRGKDIEITKKACRKFETIPVSIMNFMEGTRFTRAKHTRQGSPYRYLLRPKSGGIAFVLSAMGNQLSGIVDATIVYPQGAGTFWDLICGRIPDIRVQVKLIPVTDEIRGDYFNDRAFKRTFQNWINARWTEKDEQIDLLLNQARSN